PRRRAAAHLVAVGWGAADGRRHRARGVPGPPAPTHRPGVGRARRARARTGARGGERMSETTRPRTALIASSVVGVVMVAFIAILALSDSGPDDGPSPLLGEAAPVVVGDTLDGTAFDLDDERGRWVLVNFFAEWCAPCRVEHPELVAFHEAHAEAGD